MQPDISVVVPMQNEAPNVEQLYRELTAALEACGRPYEIVVIDDGSTDDTFEQLAALQARDPRLRVIRFRRNFGQTAALRRRLRARPRPAASSRPTATCRTIRATSPRWSTSLETQGYDIVCGWRKDRKDTFVTRRVPSMHRQQADLVGHRRDAARLRLLAEGVPRRGRQAAAALRRDAPVPAGDRQRDRRARSTEVVVNHRARRAGTPSTACRARSASSSIW